MCGRFSLASPDQDLLIQFELPELPDVKPRYNIAPSQPVAVVRAVRDGGAREMVYVRWGLIPFWANDPEIGARLINARAETAAEKPAFRAAYRKRRCLVVADGFYEWQKVNGGKQPYFIRMRDERPFAFAGLWEFWRGGEGEAIESCTLLTTQPNDLVRALHNRMPVILPPASYDLWLDPQIEDRQSLDPLLQPFPSIEMEAYPVSRWVNNPANEGPRAIQPLPHGEDQPLPGL